MGSGVTRMVHRSSGRMLASSNVDGVVKRAKIRSTPVQDNYVLRNYPAIYSFTKLSNGERENAVRRRRHAGVSISARVLGVRT